MNESHIGIPSRIRNRTCIHAAITLSKIPVEDISPFFKLLLEIRIQIFEYMDGHQRIHIHIESFEGKNPSPLISSLQLEMTIGERMLDRFVRECCARRHTKGGKFYEDSTSVSTKRALSVEDIEVLMRTWMSVETVGYSAKNASRRLHT